MLVHHKKNTFIYVDLLKKKINVHLKSFAVDADRQSLDNYCMLMDLETLETPAELFLEIRVAKIKLVVVGESLAIQLGLGPKD